MPLLLVPPLADGSCKQTGIAKALKMGWAERNGARWAAAGGGACLHSFTEQSQEAVTSRLLSAAAARQLTASSCAGHAPSTRPCCDAYACAQGERPLLSGSAWSGTPAGDARWEHALEQEPDQVRMPESPMRSMLHSKRGCMHTWLS
jgi:hypothetical protein